jgi:dolichol-phosphate mannosyltransferase
MASASSPGWVAETGAAGRPRAATGQRATATRQSAPPELAIIVPTRNERDNVAPLVMQLEQALAGLSWEVIFVDDNSPDLTAVAVRRLAGRDPRVRLLHRIGRRGLSSACVEGIAASAAPYIAVMDADLQHDPLLLPRMLREARAGDVELVVASRYVEGGGSGLAPRRRVLSRLAVRLAQLCCRVHLTDPLSGFFVIRREAFEASARGLNQMGFKILLDIAASAPRPLRCREVPCQLGVREHGASKLDALVAVQFLALLLAKLSGGLLGMRVVLFLGVGTTGLVVHLAVLKGLLALHAAFPSAQAVAVLVAMTSNFSLNNLITYRDQRLHGRQWLRGLVSFYAVCSLGALANVALASLIYRAWPSWWLAGTAGAALGFVWNYWASRVLTWRQAARSAR